MEVFLTEHAVKKMPTGDERCIKERRRMRRWYKDLEEGIHHEGKTFSVNMR